jgi:hypothetical protein
MTNRFLEASLVATLKTAESHAGSVIQPQHSIPCVFQPRVFLFERGTPFSFLPLPISDNRFKID